MLKSNDQNIEYIITACNKTVRKICNLSYDSYRILICALNYSSNALDLFIHHFVKCITAWQTVKTQSYPCS